MLATDTPINAIDDPGAVRELAAYYADLYDHAPDMYLAIDAQTCTVLDCNTTTTVLTGYAMSELVGRLVMELHHPACQERARQAFLSLIAVEEVHDVELQVIRKDGSVLDVSLSASAVRDAAGKIVRSRSVWRDITARKRAEREHAFLSAIVESSFDGIVGRDLNGIIVSWNAAAERITGYSAEEAIGRHISFMVPPSNQEQFQRNYHGLHAGIPVLNSETKRLTKAGTLIDLAYNSFPVRDAQGNLLGVSSIVRDITEQKRLETHKLASEVRFATIFHSSPVALHLTRAADGEIIDINPAAADLLGYSQEELIGRKWNELDALPGGGAVLVALQLELGKPLPVTINTRSGASRSCLATANRITVEGEPCLLVSTVDITEREQAERDRAFLSALVESSFDAIIGRDLDGTIVSWNAAAERILGFSAEEAIGRHVSSWVPPEKMAEYQAAGVTLANGQVVMNVETQRLAKDGRLVDVAFNTFLVRNPQEDILGVGNVVRDITEQKRMEAALRASEEKYRFLTESMKDVVWTMDLETGHVTYISPSIFGLLGYTPEEYAAVPLTSHLTPVCAEKIAALIQQIVAGYFTAARPDRSDYMTLELEAMHKNGAIVLVEAIAFLAPNAQTGRLELHGVSRDISAQKTYERLLKQTNTELERQVAARTDELRATVVELQLANAGKDAFLAAISHELRTPLMGVLSMAELLQSEVRGPLNPNQAKYVATIGESGQRLLGMLNDVLLYTQLISGATSVYREPCSLSDLACAAVQAAKAKAEHKRQDIALTINPAIPEIKSDGQGIYNILRLLLDNAIKFTPEGGHIEVAIAAVPAHPVQTAPAVRSAAGSVQISVADTGIGMTPEEIAGLFRPFAQADKTLARRYEGLGIGLAYVHKMVELLGGAVAVASEPGKGSCFTVTLPC